MLSTNRRSIQRSPRNLAGWCWVFGLLVVAGCGRLLLVDQPDGGGGTGDASDAVTIGGSGDVLGSGDTVSPRIGVWTNRTAGTTAAGLPWKDVASDTTGTYLVAVTTIGTLNPEGDIWTSADAGATWTNRTTGTAASGQRWQSVASDSTGTRLVAVTAFTGLSPGGEDVWTSTDSGMTWEKRITVNSTAGGVVGPTVASDATGTHLVLADGDIWTSGDSGATWTDQTAGTAAGAQIWVDLASDATGTHLVAVTGYGDIWTSGDAGATWINRTQGTLASKLYWQAVASDSTGTRLIAACQPSTTADGILYGGDIWISVDAGATWTNQTSGTTASGQLWVSVASDATGARVIAACAHSAANDIWSSSDSGTTWTNETAGTTASGQMWAAIASSVTGAHLVAVTSGSAPSPGPPHSMPCCFGDIWTN